MARPRRKPGHEGERRAAHTVNGYCRVLRAFAGWLAKAGYVDAHPLGTFRPGRLPTREVEPIAADDQQRLLEACDPRSPLDRLPNGRTFHRAARTGRRAASARIVAVKGGQLVLRTDSGDLIEIAT